MNGCELHPWMLRGEWRDDRRPLLVVDLAAWPADAPLDPLPPVPVLAIGPAGHPQARHADLLFEDAAKLAPVASRIRRMPLASMTVVQLLRAIEGLPAEKALTLESFAFAMLQGSGEHAAWLSRQPGAPIAAPGTLHVSRDGARLDLLIDRPAARNAIDRRMRDDLHEAFSLAALDHSIGQVRLRAQGRCFSVGADLAEFGTTRDPSQAHAIRARTLPAHPMIRRPEIYDIHVQGGCIGSGLELAAFAGRLTAAPDAWFQLPETGMGILPGFGGCVSIPRRIGRQRAAMLMLSGRRIGAAAALRWGLIDGLVDEPHPGRQPAHGIDG